MATSLKQIINDSANKVLESVSEELLDIKKLKTRFPTPQSMTFIHSKFTQTTAAAEPDLDRDDVPFRIIGESSIFDLGVNAPPVNYASFVSAGEFDDVYEEVAEQVATLTETYDQEDLDAAPMKVMKLVEARLNKFIKHWGDMVVNDLALRQRILVIFENVKNLGWGFLAYFNCDQFGMPNRVIVASELHLSIYMNKLAKSIGNPITKKYAMCQAMAGAINNHALLMPVMRPHVVAEFAALEAAAHIVSGTEPPEDLVLEQAEDVTNHIEESVSPPTAQQPPEDDQQETPDDFSVGVEEDDEQEDGF